MDDVYKNINDYNPSRKRKILIVFGVMIADVMKNKKVQTFIRELFIRFHLFLSQTYFSVPKDLRLNSTHYLITKINNKKELQSIAIYHSPDSDTKILWKFTENAQKNFLIF